MPENFERKPAVEPEFNKTERTLIRLYRLLPHRDRRYLHRVLFVLVRAAFKRS
jgi:hypothetical protein